MADDPAQTALPAQMLSDGDIVGAEKALIVLVARGHGNDPEIMHLQGIVRLRQRRFVEAESIFSRAREIAPHHSQLAFNHGVALVGLGRDEDAVHAYDAAVRAKPDFADAVYGLGSAFQRIGNWEAAEKHFRNLLDMAPDYVPAYLGLGGVLIETRRPVEAEARLRMALARPASPELKAQLNVNLGLALRRQRKDKEALQSYASAARLKPALKLGSHQAETLQNLGRYDDALAMYRMALAQDPTNPGLHRSYNDLLYRLCRTDEYLKSYDAFPNHRTLQLGKALFLAHERRGADCLKLYCDLAARDSRDIVAAAGVGDALLLLNAHEDAKTVFERLLVHHDGDPALFIRAAKAALLCDDPRRAVMWCERALKLSPFQQEGLAMMSICLRMTDEDHDEILNGYDSLVGVFDLDPPQGYSSMGQFNADLCAYLDRLHPGTREYVSQSLRGGTQTADHLFGAGHEIIDRLQARVTQAVRRYIRELKPSQTHPFLSRRRENFRYTGSWSSRLRENGFHVNHIHPEGWISSCYYAGVPASAVDQSSRRGWIKFGEPDFQTALKNPVRRAVQPVAGRLVLFPSYLWHGTIPFQDSADRTTIAFDVLPAG